MSTQWEWSTQDGFPGNVGTVLGNGGGDGWFRVQWDNHGSNSYQYTPDHQDIVRYNDPLENPIVSLFPQVVGAAYVEAKEEEEEAALAAGPPRELNLKRDPGAALWSASFEVALSALDTIWHKQRPLPSCQATLLSTLTTLSLGSQERLARLLLAPHPLALQLALQPQQDPSASLASLLLLASAARDGPDQVLPLLLSPEHALLPRALSLVVSDSTPAEDGLAALALLERLAGRSEEARTRLVALLLRQDDDDDSKKEEGAGGEEEGPPLPPLLERLSVRLVSVLLDPIKTPHADAHVLALRLLRSLLTQDRSLAARLLQTPLGSQLVPLVIQYSRFPDTAALIEEVTELAAAWIADLDSEAYVRTVLTAATIAGDYGKINQRLSSGGPPVVRQAMTIIRQHVQSQGAGGGSSSLEQERVVGQILQAGTLQAMVRGLDDWSASPDDVLSLAALCSALLAGSNQNEAVVDEIVSPSLVSALWPALMQPSIRDRRDVVDAVLAVLAARDGQDLKERSRKRPLLWPAVTPPHSLAAAAARAGARGGVVVAPSLGTTLAELFALWQHDRALARRSLEILTSVVAETGELEKDGLDCLLAAVEGAKSPPDEEDSRAALRIVGASTLTDEEDLLALLPTLVRWIVSNVEDKATVDAAVDLLLKLVDESGRATDALTHRQRTDGERHAEREGLAHSLPCSCGGGAPPQRRWFRRRFSCRRAR